MTAISYHETINDLQALDWSGASPFARHEWFALLENGGMKPFVALARDGDRALALPLMHGDGGLEVLTNWYAFTWSPLSVGDGLTLLNRLAADLARKTHRINLSKLPDEDGTATRLQRSFARAGWSVSREVCDTNHVLQTRGRSYAEYLAERPGKLRTTLKRKAGKVEICLTRQFSATDWADYEAIYAQSWKPEEGDPALLRQFAAKESAAGRYLFGMARSEGIPVAAQFWTVDNGTAYIHKLAHLESSKPLSAGTTLTAALFEEVIDCDKVHWIDFGTGDDPYKRDWMEQERARYRLTCLRRSNPRNWPVLVKTALRTLVSRGQDG